MLTAQQRVHTYIALFENSEKLRSIHYYAVEEGEGYFCLKIEELRTEEEEEGDADSITRAAWAERAVVRRRLHLQETRIQYSSREAIAEQFFSVEEQ